jgi:hypothetical protein
MQYKQYNTILHRQYYSTCGCGPPRCSMMSRSSCPDLASHSGTAAPCLPLPPAPLALAPPLVPASTRLLMKRPKGELGLGASHLCFSTCSTACRGGRGKTGVKVSRHDELVN